MNHNRNPRARGTGILLSYLGQLKSSIRVVNVILQFKTKC